MIAKRAPRRAGADSSFRRLARYLLREGADGADHVRYARATNCGFDDIDLAVKAIEATQALNTRTTADKTYHLILSFRAEDTDRLSDDVLLDVEETAAAALGLGDHQRVSVVHEDTDNVHVHLAISKIHPTTLRAIEPLRDFHALDAACAVLEERHDLARDNRIRSRGRRGRPAAPTAARDMSAHRGDQPFSDWIAGHRRAVLAAARDADSWEALHRGLAAFDLAIRPRGAGLVIAARAERAASLKASSLSRDLTLGALTDRLGDYQAPSREALALPAELVYAPTPAERERGTPLWERYQAERERALARRKAAFARIRGRREREIAHLRDHYAGRRGAVTRNSVMSRRQKFGVYRELANQRKEAYAVARARCKGELDASRETNPLVTWKTWLLDRAVGGDADALDTLRRAARSPRGAERFAIAGNGPAVTWPADRQPDTIRPNGDALYQLEGGEVRDTADQVRLSATDSAVVAAAVDFARRKWPARPLAIAGDAAFRHAVVTVAGTGRLDVTFEDPELERRRAILASLPAPEREDNRCIADWIAGRNATRARTADTAPLRAHVPGESGRGLYRGIRRLPGGASVALVLVDDELMVLRVSARQAERHRRHRRGTPVRFDGRGRCEFGRGPGRDRDA